MHQTVWQLDRFIFLLYVVVELKKFLNTPGYHVTITVIDYSLSYMYIKAGLEINVYYRYSRLIKGATMLDYDAKLYILYGTSTVNLSIKTTKGTLSSGLNRTGGLYSQPGRAI